MAKTIIQTIGPLYGEAINGTVFGRPNGSIFVPISNTITLTSGATTISYSGGAIISNQSVKVVAEAQDLASFVAISVYSDSGCTVQVGTSSNKPAGEFNGSYYGISVDSSNPLTTGTTYYIRAQLINTGVPVATSNVITVVGA